MTFLLAVLLTSPLWAPPLIIIGMAVDELDDKMQKNRKRKAAAAKQRAKQKKALPRWRR